MKICPHCQGVNVDDEHFCKECGCSLAAAAVYSAEQILEREMRRNARREKRRTALHVGLFALYFAFLFVLFVRALLLGTLNFFSALCVLVLLPLSCLQMFRPEVGFREFCARNVQGSDGLEPTDSYLVRAFLSGVLGLAMALALLLIVNIEIP